MNSPFLYFLLLFVGLLFNKIAYDALWAFYLRTLFFLTVLLLLIILAHVLGLSSYKYAPYKRWI